MMFLDVRAVKAAAKEQHDDAVENREELRFET